MKPELRNVDREVRPTMVPVYGAETGQLLAVTTLSKKLLGLITKEPRVGHFISDDRLKRLGHQLLCALFAAYDFPDLYREKFPYHETDPLDEFRSLEDSDFSENLVMLSALARANDDERQTLASLKKTLPDGVGVLVEEGKTRPLTAREACNKIIHAKTISFELDWSEEHPIWHRFFERQNVDIRGRYKNPKIKVTGTAQNGHEWEADINAINFLLGVSTEFWKWNLA